jgi:cell division septation protein DedD
MDNAHDPEKAVDKKTKKKDKVRSAWISFAGRIVAQLVGAIATVALGVMVLHRYTSNDAKPPAAQVEHDRYGQPAAPAAQSGPVHVIVLTPGMLGLRDIDARLRQADRTCSPALDGPAPSTAHLDDGTLLAR